MMYNIYYIIFIILYIITFIHSFLSINAPRNCRNCIRLTEILFFARLVAYKAHLFRRVALFFRPRIAVFSCRFAGKSVPLRAKMD